MLQWAFHIVFFYLRTYNTFMSLDVDYKKYFKRLTILLQKTKEYNGAVNQDKH